MEYVIIHSTRTIMVTNGLDYEDFTKKESDLPDRMKVSPKWRKQLIKEGQHRYPAEIASWKTVKALQKDAILTIKDVETDDEDAEPENEAPVEEAPKRRRKKSEEASLEEVAGE